jgi:hypothetical protein
MAKITQVEFEKWSQELNQVCTELLKNPSTQFASKADEEDFIKIAGMANFFVKQGVLEAILLSVVNLDAARLNSKIPLSALGDLTCAEWGEKVGKRMKEHCIANGYYDPSVPPDLALLKERRNKVSKILRNEEEINKLLVFADSEDRKVINSRRSFFEQIDKIIPKENNGSDEPVPREFDFLVEDNVGRVEKLISKKEEAEKAERKDNSSSSNDNNSSVPKPSSEYKSEYKNYLESEISRLQDQVSELENKIKDNTANATQKETYQKMLDNAKNDLEDKKKKKDDLDNKPKQNSTSPNDNSNKLNWAIGLGVAAVVISVFGVILFLLSGKKKKKRYKI